MEILTVHNMSSISKLKNKIKAIEGGNSKQKAQNIQIKNKMAFDKSFFGLTYKNKDDVDTR